MYLTFKIKKQKFNKFTIKDYINNNITSESSIKHVTLKTEQAPMDYNQQAIEIYLDMITEISNKYDINSINAQYKTFYIPKKSGGLRQISAPLPELMSDLKIIKQVLEHNLKILVHEKAYAYVQNKNCQKALKVHQANQSKWFLKLDIKNFFPNCSPDFTIKMLQQIYPLQDMPTETLYNALKICFKDNGLPQGTPTSPLLTNLLMVPIDYAIEEYCNKHYLIYTRYADDILISSKHTFNWKHVQSKIEQIFKDFSAPFNIKKEKTRYGSSAGRNWNLGLMFNKDNQITIGNEKKRIFKAMLNNFANDYTQGRLWPKEDVYKFNGIISYYKSIEPEYISDLILKYNQKYNYNLKEAIKYIIKK